MNLKKLHPSCLLHVIYRFIDSFVLLFQISTMDEEAQVAAVDAIPAKEASVAYTECELAFEQVQQYEAEKVR